MATVVPPEDQLLSSQQMLAEGPLARRVVDVRAGLLAIAGWSARDPRSVPAHLTDLGNGEHITVAVMADPPGGNTHPEIAAAVRRAGDLLSDQGHHVVEATPPLYEEIIEMWAMLLIGDLTIMRPLLDMVLSDDARSVLNIMIDEYPAPTLQSSLELHGARYNAMRSWSAFFAQHPVLLSPTWALPAFEHGADLRGDETATMLRETVRPVLPGNLLGIPAAIVPCGMAAGLPVGVQVMGDKYTDLRCLSIAEQIQNGEGVHTPIDPVTA